MIVCGYVTDLISRFLLIHQIPKQAHGIAGQSRQALEIMYRNV